MDWNTQVGTTFKRIVVQILLLLLHYIRLMAFFQDNLGRRRCIWYGDGAGNTIEENSSVFSLIRMR